MRHGSKRSFKAKISIRGLLATIMVIAVAIALYSRPQKTLISRGESINFRLVATLTSDSAIIDASKDVNSRFVKHNVRVVAEWVPVPDPDLLRANGLVNIVTRRNDAVTELLVLHTTNDVSDAEISTIAATRTRSAKNSDRPTLVALKPKGAGRFLTLSTQNCGRHLAIVADGYVRAVPRIATPARKEFVLSEAEIDRVRAFPSPGLLRRLIPRSW